MKLLKTSLFQQKLLRWFDQHGRKNLPWQQNKTPYRVWVSEIMLQQTQVTTVIPYFERFMQHFPQLEQLADATEDEVLHLWAGLGYYSRARNLRHAAKTVMEKFNGILPSNIDDLISLPGIGQSTAGAILAIAFNQQATILDGNVKRVLARIYGIKKPINEKNTENKLWQIATECTPHQRVADYTQAIMDLGATFCTRAKPTCHSCPFAKNCVAYQENIVHLLPAKKIGHEIPVRSANFLVLQDNERILLCKRPPSGIWGGLWSLPEMETTAEEQKIRLFCQSMHLSSQSISPLPTFRHTFSHFHLDISPVLIKVKPARARIMEDDQQIWYNLHQPQALGLPKPVHKIIESLYAQDSMRQTKKRSRRLTTATASG